MPVTSRYIKVKDLNTGFWYRLPNRAYTGNKEVKSAAQINRERRDRVRRSRTEPPQKKRRECTDMEAYTVDDPASHRLEDSFQTPLHNYRLMFDFINVFKASVIENRAARYNCVCLYAPPASGKSTFLKEFGYTGINAYFIDTDDIISQRLSVDEFLTSNQPRIVVTNLHHLCKDARFSICVVPDRDTCISRFSQRNIIWRDDFYDDIKESTHGLFVISSNAYVTHCQRDITLSMQLCNRVREYFRYKSDKIWRQRSIGWDLCSFAVGFNRSRIKVIRGTSYRYIKIPSWITIDSVHGLDNPHSTVQLSECTQSFEVKDAVKDHHHIMDPLRHYLKKMRSQAIARTDEDFQEPEPQEDERVARTDEGCVMTLADLVSSLDDLDF